METGKFFYFPAPVNFSSQFYTVIALDSRGQGESEQGEDKLSFEQYA